LEQDAAYWEVHVEQQPKSESAMDTNGTKEPVKCNAMFGVASKKDRQFYETLEAAQQEEEGTLNPFLTVIESCI
jgi:hypothetical protein